MHFLYCKSGREVPITTHKNFRVLFSTNPFVRLEECELLPLERFRTTLVQRD